MNLNIERYSKLIGLLVLSIGLTSCGLSGSAQSGKVLDEATDKPIEGAIVVAQWIGDVSSSWADSKTTCYHVATTVTAGNGKYRIPAWRLKADEKRDWHKNLSPDTVRITAYKAGYVRSDKSFTSGSHEKGTYYLKTFPGSVAERLEYLKRVISGTGCGQAEVSEKSLYDLYKEVYFEAKSVSGDDVDKQLIDWFRWSAAAVAVAQSGDVKYEEREKAISVFIRENLP